MPGIIYRAVPIRVFDFSGLAVSPATSSIVGAEAIDVSSFREVNVIARFHAIPGVSTGVAWPTGAKVTISARADEPTIEDVGLEFVGTDLATVQFQQGAGDTPPLVRAFYLELPSQLFASRLRIYVTATGGTVTGTFKTMFSIDVNAKS